ncbi:hypothetical protein CC1G_09297 [Coprinopsis cinerea okayama7|uniref:Uncharacterized protein n=1 Tax=Coprinopsis cinerea (strain Okayama-7 / 130 / ATCC MYA-4618 / FGSC 9003) TaxID=240176 RepID=A8N876_COPC7|nr:hypothetical protein CC1G_09297 [Coprinopsis cinerea okayama7\|eukprot:XP_001831032.2 hypothetical protein CC1G_09297 [Coprinopsis cinerea okayama7\
MAPRATAALGCLAAILNACQNSPLKPQTIVAILEQLDGILAWIHVSLVDGLSISRDRVMQASCFMTSGTLAQLLLLDERVEGLIFDSPKTFQIFETIWTARDSKGEPFMEYFNPRYCTILLVITRWVNHPLGVDSLVGCLLSDPARLNGLCEGLSARANLLPKLKQRKATQSQVDEHVDVVAKLTTGLARASPAIAQRLRATRFLVGWTQTVLDLQQSLRARESVLLACRLLILSTTAIEHPLRSATLLAPVIIPILAGNLPKIKIDSDLELLLTVSLRTAIENRLLFPRGIEAFQSAIDSFDPSGVKMNKLKSDAWKGLLSVLKDQGELLSRGTPAEFRICDNDSESKCQNQLIASKDENTHFSHRTRAFQIYLANSFFKSLPEWEDRQAQEHPGVPHSELFARILFGLHNPNVFYRIDDQRLKLQSQATCPAWEARRQEIFSNYRRSNDTKRRLVDWIVAWNMEYQISFLTEFQLVGVGDREEWVLRRHVTCRERLPLQNAQEDARKMDHVKTFAPAPPHGVSNSTTPNDCTLLGAIEPRTRDASVPDSTPASSTVAKRLALSLSWDMDEERSASKTHMTDPESNTAKRR